MNRYTLNGSSYSEEQVLEAASKHSLSLEEYISKFGLQLDNSIVESPTVPGDGQEKVQVEHADQQGFKDAAAYSLGGGFLGITEGQEKRVVNFLEESYSQYDNITFKEEDGMDDTVGLYIDNEFVGKYNLDTFEEENLQQFTKIKEDINAYTKKKDPEKYIVDLADNVTNELNKADTEVGRNIFQHEGNVTEHLKQAFEGNTGYEVVEANAGSDAVKITNSHKVSRVFNLEGSYKKQIRQFILKDVQQTSEYVNAEIDFKQMFDGKGADDYFTDEKLNELGERITGGKVEQYSWEDAKQEGAADEFVDMVFDDMGIDNFLYIDKETPLREKFNVLSEAQMKLFIEEELNNKSSNEQKENLKIGGGKIQNLYNLGKESYYGEGGRYEGGMGSDGVKTKGIPVKSYHEFIMNFAKDDANIGTEEQVIIANNILKLQQKNLSAEDIKIAQDAISVAMENIEGFVQFVNAEGDRVNVPKSQSEAWANKNPDAVYNQGNLDVVETNFASTLTGDEKTDKQKIKDFYENNVADLLGVEADLNKTYDFKYNTIITGVDGESDIQKGNVSNSTLKTGVLKPYLLGGPLAIAGTGYGMQLGTVDERTIQVKGEDGKWMSVEQTKTFLDRYNNRHQKVVDRHTVSRELYLHNKDVISTWGGEGRNLTQQAGAMAVNSLGMIIGNDKVYQQTWGMTDRDIVDLAGGVYSEMGYELTADQDLALDRGTWETVVEGGAGSVGILLEFAVANKATAAIRGVNLFSKGTKSINSIINGYRANKYNNGRIILTEAQILQRAGKFKMTPLKYMKKYGFEGNQVKNTWGIGKALLAESLIEGAKFASLPSSAGHRTDAFATGFGFGFMGQALAPVFGQITEASIVSRFGKKSPLWLLDNAPKLNFIYQTMLKGPTSFVAGSEVGELTKAISQDILGGNQAFANYMEENWGDYSDPSKRLISNWIVGTAFGFSHYMIPPKGVFKKGSKIKWFNDYRTLSDIELIRDEARGKNFQIIDYHTVISPAGKRKKVSPEEFTKLRKQNKNWRLDESVPANKKIGGLELNDNVAPKKGDSKKEIQRKKDLQTRNEETYQIFSNLYNRARGQYDLLDPIKGQRILEKEYAKYKEWYKEEGVDLEIAFATNAQMKQRASFSDVKDPKTGKIDKTKRKLTFNVDQLSLGLMPHELGHAGMEALFTKNARLKGDFINKMMNIAKKAKLDEIIDGKQTTLYDRMVEMNGKWDTKGRSWENARISEWELFSYLAEMLAKPKIYAQLKKANVFGEYKNLLNKEIGGKLMEKGEFDIKTESEIVEFFGNYIESINKGSNHVKVMKDFLTDVIDQSKTGDTKDLREAWEREFQSPEAPTTTLNSSVEMTELRGKNEVLAEAKRNNKNKWPSKADEVQFNKNLKEWKRLKSLVEQPKTYKKDRSNEEIVEENTRLAKSIDLLLEKSGGSRVRNLPEGSVKDNLIMNLRANNIGVLPRIVLETKNNAKAKNVPKEEIPSDREMMGEAEIQMLQLINNYNPKINPEFGAYIQSREFGLMRKGGTILNKVLKGSVKGTRTGTDKLDKEKFNLQEDFDLKGDYEGNPNRLVLRNEMFKTGEIKTSRNTRGEKIETEVVDVKKQKEVVEELHGNFNKLSTEEIAGTNFTNIRDFHAKFSGEKPHKIFTALNKANINKIVGKDKVGHIGNKWKLLYRMVSENQVVMMSGVKAEKGAKGQEGRSIELRNIILNAKNSKGEPLFDYTGKRTKDDATGSSVEIREKRSKLNQEEFLDHISIEVLKNEIQQADGSFTNGYAWKKGTTAAQKLVADALLQEVYGRNFVAQEMVTWIKEVYKNKPELQQAMAEGQILGRLSGGSSKLFSENLNKLESVNQLAILEGLKTERFAVMLNDNRKTIVDQEKAVVKTVKDYFEFVGEKHSVSKSELIEIGKDLYREFQYAPNIRQEMLIQKAVKTIEFTNKLNNITGRSKGPNGEPLSAYDVVKEWKTKPGIFRTQAVSRKVIKQLMEEFGVGAENVLAIGEHGGAGLGYSPSMEGLDAGIFGKFKVNKKTGERKFKSINRSAIYETAADFRKMVEGVEIELLQEGMGKNADFSLKTIDVLQAESNKPGVKKEVFDAVGGNGETWNNKGVDKINVSAGLNMKILKRSSDILRDLYKKGEIDHNQARSWVEMHFAGMRSLGKKSAGIALLPNMSPKEMKKLFGKNASDYVLEHITPAQYTKARMYDYILNGGTKKTALELTLRDYHTTLIPKRLDKMVNELAKTDLPSNHLPGMDPMMRYYEMAHSSDFNFGFKNVMFGKNSLRKTYDFHPNLSTKQKGERNQLLGEQYRKTLAKLKLDKGASELNSENLNHIENIQKAMANGRKTNAKKKGMSTFDFDETVGFSNNYVIATKGGKTKRIASDKWPFVGEKMVNEGWKMDFTDFNKVTDGRPGPLMQKMKNQIAKFGPENVFILTARANESAPAIHEYLKSEGINIPKENITGLGNSTGEAKALWMLKKFAEGYNDMYFVDDAMPNVKAVKDVLDKLDIKSKVQQARRIEKEISPELKEKKSLENVKDINKLDSESYENVLYSEKHRSEYERTISKHRPDLVKGKTVSTSVDEMFNLVEGLDVAASKKRKYEQIMTKWLATSKMRLPEDGYKLKEAVDLAEKYKEDVFSYKNPNQLIEKYAGKAKEKPTDPKTVKEFAKGTVTNKKHGITEHEVADTREGQTAVRKVMDTHFGPKSNPWCLAARSEKQVVEPRQYGYELAKTKQEAEARKQQLESEGFIVEIRDRGQNIKSKKEFQYDLSIKEMKEGPGVMEGAWENWKTYSKGPKSMVFQNGKLIAFKANGQYWDRMDNATDAPVITMKEGRVTKKVELVPIGKGKVQEFVMETRTVSKDKNTVTTEYATETKNYEAGTTVVENRVNGVTVKKTTSRPTFDKQGNDIMQVLEIVTYNKRGEATNNKNFEDGELIAINTYGRPFGEIKPEQIVKEKGDQIEFMGIETKTGVQDVFAESLVGGKIVEIGFKLGKGVKLESVIKTSPNGEVRLDLKKVLKVDPDVKGLPKDASVLYSENLSKDFNRIIEEVKGVGAEKKYGEAKGRLVGKKKGKFEFFGTPGAEDFAGLVTYAFAGKGKLGEAHKAFFTENLQKPFGRAYSNIHNRKQSISNDYKALREEFKSDVTSILNEKIDGVFTVDQAIRVYNWTKSGFEVPGVSKTDLKMLNEFVVNDSKLTAFAENLRAITRMEEGYVKPKDYWLGENITMDMNNVVDRVYRKEALEEFTTNREAIFGKWENGRLVGDNMNKIEAAYGPKHREALENILWRMEKGTNRTVGRDSNTNKWMNWVNSATGTIMFFNQKSAALQTISSLNYVNGTFNNPFRAAQAFANQPQYWGDFMRIINSDMLTQRRSGLKINVEASELIDRVGGGEGGFAKFRAVLLEKGFIPTKWADSFAIASGGATYYRNSIRKYKKEGLNEKEAESRAWEDFTQMTEATQQSSRPDLVSMQQASPIGRPILAFANTPLQMFRRHKRRIQDIANNRGNMVENVLSAVYYGFAQTMIFSYLANAMFAVDDESEDEKDIAFAKKQKSRHVNTIADSYLRGMGTGGAGVSALKNGIISFMRENDKGYRADYGNTVIEMLNVSPPIGSKARKMYSATKAVKFNQEEMVDMGLDFDNPAVMAIAKVVSAGTNIPTDRVLSKVNNIRDASMGDFETWQRVAMFMGIGKYSLNLEGGPGQEAVDASSQRIKLNKRMEKYGVTTEKEVIRIDRSKQVRKLNKEQQQEMLIKMKLRKSLIFRLQKEEDRIEKIMEYWDGDSKSVDSLLNLYVD